MRFEHQPPRFLESTGGKQVGESVYAPIFIDRMFGRRLYRVNLLSVDRSYRISRAAVSREKILATHRIGKFVPKLELVFFRSHVRQVTVPTCVADLNQTLTGFPRV